MVDSDVSSDGSGTQETEITKEELEKEIKKILQNASLKDTTTKKVIQKLEKKYNTDLSAKKKVIDQLVMDYVNSLESEGSGGETEEDTKMKTEKDDDDEDEEEIKEKRDSKKRGKKAEDKKKKSPAKGKKGGVIKKRGNGSGYTRPVKLSPELSELVGATALPRHEVVKRVWAIIKERQLTDPKNRQFAICDKPLYKVIGTQRFYTFGMMKYLKNHFIVD